MKIEMTDMLEYVYNTQNQNFIWVYRDHNSHATPSCFYLPIPSEILRLERFFILYSFNNLYSQDFQWKLYMKLLNNMHALSCFIIR